MAWYDKVISFSWPNVLIAVGVAAMAPVLLPVVGSVVRPVAKGAVKGGLMVKDAVVGFAAEAGEQGARVSGSLLRIETSWQVSRFNL